MSRPVQMILIVGITTGLWLLSATASGLLSGSVTGPTTVSDWPGSTAGAAPVQVSRPPASPVISPVRLATTTRKPALSPYARRSCPHTASACVDLRDRLTWLQAGGRVTYGPVRMEPGPPGTRHATPRGVFHVAWKAGASFVSTEYDEPMPYPVFFAPGGIAFHAGSLSKPSHGCVHLSIGAARAYHDRLPVGAEVAVF